MEEKIEEEIQTVFNEDAIDILVEDGQVENQEKSEQEEVHK